MDKCKDYSKRHEAIGSELKSLLDRQSKADALLVALKKEHESVAFVMDLIHRNSIVEDFMKQAFLVPPKKATSSRSVNSIKALDFFDNFDLNPSQREVLNIMKGTPAQGNESSGLPRLFASIAGGAGDGTLEEDPSFQSN